MPYHPRLMLFMVMDIPLPHAVGHMNGVCVGSVMNAKLIRLAGSERTAKNGERWGHVMCMDDRTETINYRNREKEDGE